MSTLHHSALYCELCDAAGSNTLIEGREIPSNKEEILGNIIGNRST